jgi:hypothetical protein
MKAVQNIKTHMVDSSNIRKLGHDPETKTLEVHFYGGGKYQYNPVSKETYETLDKASSIGRYFAENIKNNSSISYTKIQ